MSRLNFGVHCRLATINHNFEICETYPPYLFVPKSIDDETLGLAAEYRGKHRFPAAVWCHDGSILIRSAQISILHMSAAPSSADIALLNAYTGASRACRMLIVDCRDFFAANGNMFKGGGSESVNVYDNASMGYLGIKNIHDVRNVWLNLQGKCTEISRIPHECLVCTRLSY